MGVYVSVTRSVSAVPHGMAACAAASQCHSTIHLRHAFSVWVYHMRLQALPGLHAMRVANTLHGGPRCSRIFRARCQNEVIARIDGLSQDVDVRPTADQADNTDRNHHNNIYGIS